MTSPGCGIMPHCMMLLSEVEEMPNTAHFKNHIHFNSFKINNIEHKKNGVQGNRLVQYATSKRS
jgi:hypothetical protein